MIYRFEKLLPRSHANACRIISNPKVRAAAGLDLTARGESSTVFVAPLLRGPVAESLLYNGQGVKPYVQCTPSGADRHAYGKFTDDSTGAPGKPS